MADSPGFPSACNPNTAAVCFASVVIFHEDRGSEDRMARVGQWLEPYRRNDHNLLAALDGLNRLQRHPPSNLRFRPFLSRLDAERFVAQRTYPNAVARLSSRPGLLAITVGAQGQQTVNYLAQFLPSQNVQLVQASGVDQPRDGSQPHPWEEMLKRMGVKPGAPPEFEMGKRTGL
jgi:hypothetical protein